MESWEDKDFDQISHVIPGMRWILGYIDFYQFYTALLLLYWEISVWIFVLLLCYS